ncbi:MAG: cold shock domain-containing protein [Bacilli bacterium]|jgi:CspA family cold shock protein
MKGTVKMFNKEKGYGFIHTEENTDVFFHYSSLIMDDYKTAAVGEKVEFDVEESERGLRAANIKKI